MSFSLTSNFFKNSRGVTFSDAGGVAWSFNKNTNTLTASAAAGGTFLSSVGLADTSTTPIYTVTNSPLTANGTLDITLNTQNANLVFAGPGSGGAAQPGFRAMVIADLPTGIPNANLANTSVTVSAGTGLSGGGAATLGGAAVTLSLTSPVTAILGGTGQTVYAVGDLLYASTTTALSRLADVAVGSYLRSGGVNTAPLWSTVTLPNTATQGDLWYASAANVMSALADVAAGSYLRSGGVGTAPVYSTTTIPNDSVLGDIWYGSAAHVISALAGTTLATKKFLTQTGTGTVSAAPAWGTIAAGDLPANGANPTANVALVAVNGSATTWMRSDGAPALDVTISPTWTGFHDFKRSAEIIRLESTTARGSGNCYHQYQDPTGQKGYIGYASASTDDMYMWNVLNAGMHFATNNKDRFDISAAGNITAAVADSGTTFGVAAGTASITPMTLASGTLNTVAVAGALEYDGTDYYFTNETTSGRGLVPVEQFFHLAADGTGITTIANFFGTTSNISLVSGGYYEIEIVCFFTMGGTGSVITWSLINSAAPTSMDLAFEMCPVTGVVAPPGTATMLSGQIVAGASATTTVVTTSLTASTSQYARFRIMLKNGTGTSLKIQVAETTTTTALTPKIGSYWRCKRIPAGNVGTFAA